MPSKKNYNLVPNNECDLRIPLHSDEAFQHGITFQAKYIGSLDVPRPNSRLEIVAAMRRIRYEFKSQGIKKRKVLMEVSMDGVKVSLLRKKKKNWPVEDSTLLLMHHPVYRIFYVSHDSQDLKTFSYIARDGSSNYFRCNVFKTSKKSQAMKIVRTVGQAFEVCHKLTTTASTVADTDDFSDDHISDAPSSTDKSKKGDVTSDLIADPVQEEVTKVLDDSVVKSTETVERPIRLELAATTAQQQVPQQQLQIAHQQQQQSHQQQSQSQQHQQLQIQQQSHQQQVQSQQHQQPQIQQQQTHLQQQLNHVTPTTPLALQHEVLLLRQQVEQQQQQTQAALAQVKLLKDQLAAESAARLEAQARTHQLLIHNKELLDHIQMLVLQMQDLESKVATGSNTQQGSGPSLSQLPLTARIMEWLQLQPVSRPESGYVEDLAATQTIPSAEDEILDDVEPHRADPVRRSLPSSNKMKWSRRWKLLSRKSSWRSL